MTTIASLDNNILSLPNEVIRMIIDKMSDNDLMARIDIPEFSVYAIELLKQRITKMTMENLTHAYMYEPIRTEVQIQFNKLSHMKYKTLKNIYCGSTDENIRHSIEVLIADNFVEVVGQSIPEGMNFIMQVDTIRAVLITEKFMELVDNNGGLFNGFDAYNGSVDRILTNMDIKLVNTEFAFGYSYPLNFDIGFFPNKVRVARGSMIENEIDYNFNSIFMRLYESIVGKFSLNEMKINTHFIGNNSCRLNESFEF